MNELLKMFEEFEEKQQEILQKVIELPPDKIEKQIIEESIKAHHKKKKPTTDRKMNKVRLRQYLIKQLNVNLEKFPIEFLRSERITYGLYINRKS